MVRLNNLSAAGLLTKSSLLGSHCKRVPISTAIFPNRQTELVLWPISASHSVR